MNPVHTLKSKRGNMLPLGVCILIVLCLIAGTVMEYIRLTIIVKGVRDALQSAALALTTDNYEFVYNGLREGHTGGYDMTAATGQALYTDTELIVYLQDELGLRKTDNAYEKTVNGTTEYRLTNIYTGIQTSPYAPHTNDERMMVENGCVLVVPLMFGGFQVTDLEAPLRTFATYQALF